MEEFIRLLAELLSVPLTEFAAIIMGVIVWIFVLFFDLFFENIANSEKEQDIFSKVIYSQKFKTSLWFLKKAALLGLIFIVITLSIINFVFFDPAMRKIADIVSKRTGIKIEFASVSGNIFTGHINFADMKVIQTKENKTNFDLAFKNAEIDLDMLSLLLRPIVFEKINISDVSGNIKQQDKVTSPQDNKKLLNLNLGKLDITLKKKSDKDTESQNTQNQPKREFIINNLVFRNINVSFIKGTNLPINISLENIISQSFRSNYAIFDIFFRSNINGSIDGHKIAISNKESGWGEKARWEVENLPVRTVSYFLDKTPINWFQDGVIDIVAEDEWQRKTPEINMDWQLKMHNVHMAVPENIGSLEKIAVLPVANYINSHNEGINLQLKFTTNEKQFEGAASLDAAGLWDALVSGTRKSIAKNVVTQAP